MRNPGKPAIRVIPIFERPVAVQAATGNNNYSTNHQGMAQKKLSELSTEALIVRAKSLKTSIAVMAVAIVIMVATGAYLTFRKGFGVFTVLPTLFIYLWIVNVKLLKDVRAELAKRNG